MIQRGRKGATQSAVIDGGFARRPEPPIELTVRQAQIWRDVVASEPTDFFATAALRAMLCDYCRHLQTGETLTEQINVFKPEWIRTEEGASRYNLLLRMRERETRASGLLATKLRLTNQSRYQPDTAATAARKVQRLPRPWEAA